VIKCVRVFVLLPEPEETVVKKEGSSDEAAEGKKKPKKKRSLGSTSLIEEVKIKIGKRKSPHKVMESRDVCVCNC